MKIIHIVENLDRNAVENWLVRMLAHATRRSDPNEWTFYCALGRPGALDERARELGGRVVYSPEPLSRLRQFTASLRTELQRGRYDVLHCHHDLMNALYLTAAIGLPLKRRVSQVHNADEAIPVGSEVKRAVLRPVLRQINLRLADRIVGISQHTLDTFLGGTARRDRRDCVLYYGVEPGTAAANRETRASWRTDIGVAPDTQLVLFAGRLVPEKNPGFALDLFGALSRREQNVALVFAGDGSEAAKIAARTKAMGLGDRVRMLGWRNDVRDIMSQCDLFVLPRPEAPMEGFGLAVLEAQLAGLKVLVSRGVPRDTFLPRSVFEIASLAAGPERWADLASKLLAAPAPCVDAARDDLARSAMNMDRAFDNLYRIYNL